MPNGAPANIPEDLGGAPAVPDPVAPAAPVTPAAPVAPAAPVVTETPADPAARTPTPISDLRRRRDRKAAEFDKASAAANAITGEEATEEYYEILTRAFSAGIAAHRAAVTLYKAKGLDTRTNIASKKSIMKLLEGLKEEKRNVDSGAYEWQATADIEAGTTNPGEIVPAVWEGGRWQLVQVHQPAEPAAVATAESAEAPQTLESADSAEFNKILDGIVRPYMDIERETPGSIEELRALDPGGDEDDVSRLPWYKGRAGGLTDWTAQTLEDIYRYGLEPDAPRPTQTQRALERVVQGSIGPLGTAWGGPPSKIWDTHYEEALPGDLAGQTSEKILDLWPEEQLRVYKDLSFQLLESEKDTQIAADAFSKAELALIDRIQKMSGAGRTPERGSPEERQFIDIGSEDVGEKRETSNEAYLTFFKKEKYSDTVRRSFVDVTNALTKLYAENPGGWEMIVETPDQFNSRMGAALPSVELALDRIPRTKNLQTSALNRMRSQARLRLSRNPAAAVEAHPEAYNALIAILQGQPAGEAVRLYEEVGFLMDEEEEKSRVMQETIPLTKRWIDAENSYIEDPSPKDYTGEYAMGQKIKIAHEGAWNREWLTAGVWNRHSFGVELLIRQSDAAYKDLTRLGLVRALLHAAIQSQ